MTVSFSTNFSKPGIVASKSKPLPPQPLQLSSALFWYKFSIPRIFSTNGIYHRRLCAQEKSNESSKATSVKTLLEEQSQSQFRSKSQFEMKEVDSLTEVASELKQMPREKETDQKGDNLSKLMGTTGIVLAVIVGSTAALLSVNAVLAELSDKLFDGRIKIQDFF